MTGINEFKTLMLGKFRQLYSKLPLIEIKLSQFVYPRNSLYSVYFIRLSAQFVVLILRSGLFQ